MNIVFDAGSTILIAFSLIAGLGGGWLLGYEKGRYEGFIAGRRTRGLTGEGK